MNDKALFEEQEKFKRRSLPELSKLSLPSSARTQEPKRRNSKTNNGCPEDSPGDVLKKPTFHDQALRLQKPCITISTVSTPPTKGTENLELRLSESPSRLQVKECGTYQQIHEKESFNDTESDGFKMVIEAAIADDCVKSEKSDRRKSGSAQIAPSDCDSPGKLSKDSFELVLPTRRVKSQEVRLLCVCSNEKS